MFCLINWCQKSDNLSIRYLVNGDYFLTFGCNLLLTMSGNLVQVNGFLKVMTKKCTSLSSDVQYVCAVASSRKLG